MNRRGWNRIIVRLLTVAAVLWGVWAPGGGAALADDEPDPAGLVRRSYAARWERPVHFREVRTILRGDGSETVVRRVWWRPRHGFRMEEDYEQGRRTMVWNEGGQWLYDTRFPFALHVGRRAGPGPGGAAPHAVAPRDTEQDDALREQGPLGWGVDRPLRTPGFTLHGSWSSRPDVGPGGRPVYVVERRGRGVGSRWWIDREHHFPWKEEHYGPDDRLWAVILRSDVQFDADLSDELFTFDAPGGVDVLDEPREWRRRAVLHDMRGRAPFAAALPRFVPDGFELIDGDVARLQGRPVLHWRFYDGERLLSVFQMEAEPDRGGRRRSARPTVTFREEGTVVGAVRGGYLFFVVGDVTPEEAMAMLDSLEELDN